VKERLEDRRLPGSVSTLSSGAPSRDSPQRGFFFVPAQASDDSSVHKWTVPDSLSMSPAELRQPRDDRNPSRLVLGVHLPPARLSVAVAGVHAGQRLPASVPGQRSRFVDRDVTTGVKRHPGTVGAEEGAKLGCLANWC
jgi:hypothetical protein